MEILPCSRVGHVFRDEHPYDFGKKGSNNVFVKNNNRFVHTWMDEYTDFYYGTRPNAKSIEPGDLSVREHFKVLFSFTDLCKLFFRKSCNVRASNGTWKTSILVNMFLNATPLLGVMLNEENIVSTSFQQNPIKQAFMVS